MKTINCYCYTHVLKLVQTFDEVDSAAAVLVSVIRRQTTIWNIHTKRETIN